MREVLPTLNLRAKLCLTDPPYPLTSGGRKSGEMGGCFRPDVYDNSGALFDLVDWTDMAPIVYDALAPDADAVVMTNDRNEADARVAFEYAGFKFHRLLVWNKGTATPNRWYMPDCEFALYLWKGRARVINNCGSKALIRCPQRDVSQFYLPDDLPAPQALPHPTEKPVGLMRHWLVNSTAPPWVSRKIPNGSMWPAPALPRRRGWAPIAGAPRDGSFRA